jgi:hypothetical protein
MHSRVRSIRSAIRNLQLAVFKVGRCIFLTGQIMVERAFSSYPIQQLSASFGEIPMPVAFGSAILKVVDSEQPPLRVFFGEMPLNLVPGVCQQRLDTWNEWATVSREAEGR